MPVFNISLLIALPLCTSLKEKRNLIKPIIQKVQCKFNVSISEMALNDKWRSALISIVMVSNNSRHLQSESQAVLNYIEENFRQIEIIDYKIDTL